MSISGKVAKVIDEYTIVINRGSNDGVKEGMRFVVVAEGDEVNDPETGDSLGKWEVVKGRVVALHVQERLTVCTSEPLGKEDAEAPRTLSAAMVEVSMPHLRGVQRAKLNVRPSDVSGSPTVGPIAPGDRVRSVES